MGNCFNYFNCSCDLSYIGILKEPNELPGLFAPLINKKQQPHQCNPRNDEATNLLTIYSKIFPIKLNK